MSEEHPSTEGESVIDPDAENVHYVCATEDLEDGERVIVDVDGMEIAVFNVDGEFHGLLNYCVHQGGPLAEGLVSGGVTCTMTDDDWELEYDESDKRVACPWHGWQFEIDSGEHTASSDYRIPTFEVAVLDDQVYVRR